MTETRLRHSSTHTKWMHFLSMQSLNQHYLRNDTFHCLKTLLTHQGATWINLRFSYGLFRESLVSCIQTRSTWIFVCIYQSTNLSVFQRWESIDESSTENAEHDHTTNKCHISNAILKENRKHKYIGLSVNRKNDEEWYIVNEKANSYDRFVAYRNKLCSRKTNGRIKMRERERKQSLSVWNSMQPVNER
jgi:hypothetical protein